MPYTYIPKPSAGNYTYANPNGKEQYDQFDVIYDSTTTFYDGANPNQYTKIAKPSAGTYTYIAKPS